MSQWQDLDCASSFSSCTESLKTAGTRSFAVRFNSKKALCSLNPSEGDIEAFLPVLDGKKDSESSTRWINFWSGESQAKAIKLIAKRYGMSPRLTALMCSTRSSAPDSPAIRPKPGSPVLERYLGRSHAAKVDVESTPDQSHIRMEPAKSSSRPSAFGEIIDSLWHFCSVDRGPRYLYVGFNALFTVPGVELARQDSHLRKPNGMPVWTSLVLCDDGTVVSVFEQPPDGTPPEYIKAMRANVLNIFRHLSKHHTSTSTNLLQQVSVRSSEESDQADAAALLFYYLFDDWVTTYSLITRRNHPYRDLLEALREKMLEAADTNSIKTLDLVGRQLTVLKLMYQSYELIVRRILKYANTSATISPMAEDGDSVLEYPNVHDVGEWAADRTYSPQQGSDVKLPPSAVGRFERLRDRIRLYALTEIEECLKEKDSLVFMNFNLVSLKESQAVERLTRTTILLAKVTILFLPVSLMTGYFSVQIKEIETLYSLKTYWICFLVVLVTSILGLTVFGVATDRVRGRIPYQSLTRTTWEKLKRAKSQLV